MNQQKHLAEANRHIAELTVQIIRQRVIVKDALDTGQQSEMAESLLYALEESLAAFEKHRELVLDQLKRRPSAMAVSNTSSHSFGQMTFAIPRAFQGFLQAIDH
jgi:hypothetical protein